MNLNIYKNLNSGNLNIWCNPVKTVILTLIIQLQTKASSLAICHIPTIATSGEKLKGKGVSQKVKVLQPLHD